MDLLDAGIDVITTVNVAHLDCIADAVQRIIELPVRERVPDRVLRKASQIELVGSSPEQLRRRMLHGNIYSGETAREALTHYFQADRLTALRELVLRFLADIPRSSSSGTSVAGRRVRSGRPTRDPGRSHHGPRNGRHRAPGRKGWTTGSRPIGRFST